VPLRAFVCEATVDRDQAAVRAVKEDFGPGESILIQWTLTNNAPREHALNLDGDRRSFSLFSFEARRNGETVSVSRRLDKPEKDFAWVQKTLAPATKLDLWIDLRGLAWADPRWLDTRGAYEVCVIYRGADVGQEVRSGWALFKVTSPGTPLPTTIDGVEQIVMLAQGQGRRAPVNIVGIEPGTGKVLWTYNKWSCSIPVPSPTALGDGRFFIAGDYRAIGNSLMIVGTGHGLNPDGIRYELLSESTTEVTDIPTSADVKLFVVDCKCCSDVLSKAPKYSSTTIFPCRTTSSAWRNS
jgi:hypothetical protein